MNVIVIGAGCGGLTAGALLAKSGRKVLVLEQTGSIGGCCSTFEKDGFSVRYGRFDRRGCRHHPEGIREAGHDPGARNRDGSPATRSSTCFYRDGSQVAFPLSEEETAGIIAAMSPRTAWIPALYRPFCQLHRWRRRRFLHQPGQYLSAICWLSSVNARFSPASCLSS